jgi:RNA polymerase sigma-70 factor, ECF subfamily
MTATGFNPCGGFFHRRMKSLPVDIPEKASGTSADFIRACLVEFRASCYAEADLESRKHGSNENGDPEFDLLDKGLQGATSMSANPTEATDHKLMAAVAQGDEEAFEEIVLRHQETVWKVAYRFLGDRMEAEDVAQEAFLRVLEASGRYRAKTSFRTYLYRIVTHLCIDRSRKRRPIMVADLPDISDPSLDPVQDLIGREQRMAIQGALDSLPPNQKAALILKHYQGLSYAEIATVLGITTKAVEGLIGRAKTTLQTSSLSCSMSS